MTSLLSRSATELVDDYRSGALSPIEVVDAALAEVESDPHNSVITSCPESARAAAARSAERYRRGSALPMDGVPIGIKDTIATRGIETSGADAIYAGWIPDEDATVVARLLAAGAVPVAKHNAYAFALGHTNTHHGVVTNPWDPARTTGGSSSGAGASVATRQVPISIGSDTGGSIRLPASWCGVSGLKPTYGRVPNRGAMPLAWSFDTIGPLARTVDDLALTMQCIAGHDPRDGSSSRRAVPDYLDGGRTDVAGLRIGMPENWFFDICDPQIEAAVRAAALELEEAGATIVPVSFPHADLTMVVGWICMLGEIASAHEPTAHRFDEYDEAFQEYLLTSSFVELKDYLRASRLRTVVQDDYRAAFELVDMIIAPGNVTYAPRLDDFLCQVGDDQYGWIEVSARSTYMANITGLPSLALPAGLGWNDLPLGIQLLGRPFDERTMLRVGRYYQSITQHHELDPADRSPR